LETLGSQPALLAEERASNLSPYFRQGEETEARTHSPQDARCAQTRRDLTVRAAATQQQQYGPQIFGESYYKIKYETKF
jgi:hypothetical protein